MKNSLFQVQNKPIPVALIWPISILSSCLEDKFERDVEVEYADMSTRMK